MDEFEKMFKEEALANEILTESYADKLIKNAEDKFIAFDYPEGDPEEEELLRKSEEERLISKLKELQKKKSQLKNLKNPSLRHLNVERAKKRKEISYEIEKIKDRLEDIKGEREMSQEYKTV